MTDQPSQTSASGRAVVNTVTGAALVISALGSSISLAALIFSGPLEPGLPQATSAFIISAGVMSLVIALRSPLVPAVAMSQDAPAVVTAAIAAGYVASDGSTTGTDVLVVLAVITAATGLALVVLGSTGGSHIVRYLPHSVVSGFIAGTGWLLFKGGIEVMARTSVSLDSLDTFASGEIVRLWLPGLALGVLVTGLSSRPNLPVAAASAVVAIAAVMFYAVTYAFSSLSEAERDGWLMGPFDGASQVSLITPTELGEAPWGLVAESSAGLGGVVLVALVALLLNLSGLETLTRSRLDLDRELRMVGWTNLASAPLGATPVFHALGDTALARRMGVHGRRITVVVAVLTIAFGVLGAALIGWVPRFLPGGLLIAVGLGLLADWLAELRRQRSRIEAALSTAILLAIATIGILEGIVLGIVAACVLFVWRYSQNDPVHREATGSSRRSRIDRTPMESAALNHLGDRIIVFELHGHLFFGSMIRMVDRVQDRCIHATPKASHVIVDLTRVTGMDVSATALLTQLAETLGTHDVTFHLVLPGEDHRGLPGAVHHRSLDGALEAAEGELLRAGDLGGSPALRTLPASLRSLDEHLTRTTAKAGTKILANGDPGDSMFLLLAGQASAYRTASNDVAHRLRTFRAPSWIGEIGFLRGEPRSADVVADTDLDYIVIDGDALTALRSEDPELAGEVMTDIARQLAGRSATLTEALMRALD